MKAIAAGRVSKFLAAAGLLWCISIGIWIWVTPIQSSGVSTQTWWSVGADGVVSSGERTVPFESYRRFADLSRLGALPLLIPVMLATLGVWAAWRNKQLLLSLTTAMLLVFCVLAGFSIGRGYFPAAGAMLWALLVRFDAEPDGAARVSVYQDYDAEP